MNYDGLLQLVKKRRSIRRFKPEPIPDEYIDKIIEAARWAPSGGNSQPWEFIVVRQPESRAGIIQLVQEGEALTHRLEPHQRTTLEASGIRPAAEIFPWLGGCPGIHIASR